MSPTENEANMVVAPVQEYNWQKRYPQLYALAKRWVYQLNVTSWQGQEEDIAWDIVQESMLKVFEYAQEAEKGERKPIESLPALLTTTAQRYAIDLFRREKRLRRESADTIQDFRDEGEHFSDVAIEHLYQESLFFSLVHEIAHFPAKQRRALLIDLTRWMALGEEPSLLQVAFRAEGISLEEYQYNQPTSQQERNRHAALLSQAHRRLRNLYRGEVHLPLIKAPRHLPIPPTMVSKTQKDRAYPKSEASRSPVNTFREERTSQAASLPAIASFIDALPEPYRTPVQLHSCEMKSYTEIAHLLGLRKGTVKSLISRGQHKLQRLLANAPSSGHTPQTNQPRPKNIVCSEELISTLPLAYQEPVRLHSLFQKSYSEIADLLQLPKGTVKSYISRGHKLLSYTSTLSTQCLKGGAKMSKTPEIPTS